MRPSLVPFVAQASLSVAKSGEDVLHIIIIGLPDLIILISLFAKLCHPCGGTLILGK